MDLFDFLWNLSQERQIDELRKNLEQERTRHDLARWDLPKVQELAAENLELKVRLGLLVRLLIAKNIITAQEYAALIAQTHAKS
jgi:hypothetical protein